MCAFLDINHAAHGYEMCDFQSLGRLACVAKELYNLVNASLKRKKGQSVYELRMCFLEYGFDETIESCDLVCDGIGMKTKLLQVSQIFNDHYCIPIHYREKTRHIYRDDHKIYCCGKRRTLIMIKRREKQSANFLQALGWPLKPSYSLQFKECRDYM